MKTLIIEQILKLKPTAISLGFDFPTEDPANATLEELEVFLQDLEVFIKNEGE